MAESFSTRIGEGNASITTGARVNSATAAARRRPQYLEKLIHKTRKAAPLNAMLERTGRIKPVGQAEFFHLEKDYLPLQVEVDGSHDTTDTTIQLTSGHASRVNANQELLNPDTGEIVLVSSRDTGTDIITVTRNFAGSATASIADDATFVLLPLADTENNTSPESVNGEPNIVKNACQIAKEAVELSRRAMKQDNFGPDEYVEALAQVTDKFTIEQERAMFFGYRVLPTDGEGANTATGGFDYWISTNVNPVGGILTEAQLNDFICDVYRRNHNMSGSMAFFAGENTIKAMDGFGRDVLQTNTKDTMMGMEIGKYRNSFGTINVIQSAQLSSITHTNFAQRSYLINMDLVKKTVYKGGEYKAHKDKGTPDKDGQKDFFLEDFGLYLGSEAQHGKLTGVTG